MNKSLIGQSWNLFWHGRIEPIVHYDVIHDKNDAAEARNAKVAYLARKVIAALGVCLAGMTVATSIYVSVAVLPLALLSTVSAIAMIRFQCLCNQIEERKEKADPSLKFVANSLLAADFFCNEEDFKKMSQILNPSDLPLTTWSGSQEASYYEFKKRKWHFPYWNKATPLIFVGKLYYGEDANGNKDSGDTQYRRLDEIANYKPLYAITNCMACVYFSEHASNSEIFKKEEIDLKRVWFNGWIGRLSNLYPYKSLKVIHIGKEQTELSEKQKQDLQAICKASSGFWRF